MKTNIKKWFKCASIRAIKTFAQTLIASVGTTAIYIGDVNWIMVISSSLLAALLSFLSSIAGLPEVE